MGNKGSRKNKEKFKRKNALPVLASDEVFLYAFLKKDKHPDAGEENASETGLSGQKKLNKHGLPFLDDYETWLTREKPDEHLGQVLQEDNGAQDDDSAPEEDFSLLLEQSLKQKDTPRHIPKPIPLKRRLKRYPPPETDLDLHGFTAIGAQIKARSFISSALQQGYFTLRIIVGKGLHSDTGPVLPDVVEDLLKEMKKDSIVLAYEWEGKKKIRSGAVVVYLKHFTD